ncbi:helix-turn-helix transcriptional regulator [Photobacterium angustum]|uniref:HTH araC/xylS-type domain-containing protein n=1 Tax=Photobacterium angustum TaxID=661 RepID=A0A2S7VLB9_PHOAN|nr:helix-turn-helix transcriptional regulator [Photobacterium angustum]PQJ62878.1 hypothetical protein BTO08_21995 [Photobacterium angustum]
MLIVEKEKKFALNTLLDNKVSFLAKNNHIISFSGCEKITIKSSSGCVDYSENEIILLEKGHVYKFFFMNTENIDGIIYSIINKRWNKYYKFYFHYLKSKVEVLSCGLGTENYIINALYVNFYHTVNDKMISKFNESDIINSITCLVSNDLKRKWSYDLICELLYLSPATLYRELSKKNTSLKELTNHLRLTEAATLLRGTKLSVGKIAHEVGFGSSSYFGKVFKKSFNCTPVEYRKLIN